MANDTILLIDYEPRSMERTKSPLIALGYRIAVANEIVPRLEYFVQDYAAFLIQH